MQIERNLEKLVFSWVCPCHRHVKKRETTRNDGEYNLLFLRLRNYWMHQSNQLMGNLLPMVKERERQLKNRKEKQKQKQRKKGRKRRTTAKKRKRRKVMGRKPKRI